MSIGLLSVTQCVIFSKWYKSKHLRRLIKICSFYLRKIYTGVPFYFMCWKYCRKELDAFSKNGRQLPFYQSRLTGLRKAAGVNGHGGCKWFRFAKFIAKFSKSEILQQYKNDFQLKRKDFQLLSVFRFIEMLIKSSSCGSFSPPFMYIVIQ